MMTTFEQVDAITQICNEKYNSSKDDFTFQFAISKHFKKKRRGIKWDIVDGKIIEDRRGAKYVDRVTFTLFVSTGFDDTAETLLEIRDDFFGVLMANNIKLERSGPIVRDQSGNYLQVQVTCQLS